MLPAPKRFRGGDFVEVSPNKPETTPRYNFSFFCLTFVSSGALVPYMEQTSGASLALTTSIDYDDEATKPEFPTRLSILTLDEEWDDWRWKVHGSLRKLKKQKEWRAYYVCTQPKCPARFQVSWSGEDAPTDKSPYTGLRVYSESHNHEKPPNPRLAPEIRAEV